jgi:hypothetical protein
MTTDQHAVTRRACPSEAAYAEVVLAEVVGVPEQPTHPEKIRKR